MNPQGPNQQQDPTTPPAGGVPPVAPGVWQPPAPQQPSPMQSYQQPQDAASNTANYSVDYLNQIAPKEQKVVNRFAVIALIAGVLVSALFGVILLSSSSGPNANDQLSPIGLRIATLETVTEAQQPHLKETQISEANAALNSSLTSLKSEIDGIMKDRKIKTGAKATGVKAEKTYSDTLATTLDESYQRGTLDTIYTSQMTYELTLLKSKINKLKRSTKSTVLIDFCNDASSNIDTVLAAYKSFEEAK